MNNHQTRAYLRFIPFGSTAVGRGQILLACITLLVVSACNNDTDTSKTTSQTTYKSADSDTPSLTVAALSKTEICESIQTEGRLQYRVKFSDKLHFGVSSGQKMHTDSPVPMHITRSEVRTLDVKRNSEICFHFDNQQNKDITVTLSHKIT